MRGYGATRLAVGDSEGCEGEQNSLILLQHWRPHCRDKKMQNSVMGLGLTGLQEESGLMEMNGELATEMFFLGPDYRIVPPPSFSLPSSLFLSSASSSWPFLCCHSVFAVGLWFLLASAPNTTDSLQGSRPKSLLENKFEDMDFGFSCLSLVLKKAALPLHKCVA